MQKMKLTAVELISLVRSYRKGVKVDDLAKKHGVSSITIYDVFKKLRAEGARIAPKVDPNKRILKAVAKMFK